MYPNKMSFLRYEFLRIKRFFATYVKITKETAIYKNTFSQSFKKNLVQSLVIEEVAKSEFCNDVLRIIPNQYLS